MKKNIKEMTEYGPVRRLGDYLEACIHTHFTIEADQLLQSGRITREQRIALSNAIGSALDAFNQSMPAELKSMPMDSRNEVGMYSLSKALNGINAGFKQIVDWFKDEKKSTPVPKDTSMFRMLKVGGEAYVLLTYSNKWEDREGDIISKAAHQQFAKDVNEGGLRPQITPFHQPSLSEEFWLKVFSYFGHDIPKLNAIIKRVYRDTGSAIAEVDRVVYMNGFSIMVGKVYPDMMDVAERLAAMPDIGSSHGFVASDFKQRSNGSMIVDRYWSFEGSPLPRNRAANPLTALAFKEKSSMKVFTKKQKADLTKADSEFLRGLFGASRWEKIQDNYAELEPVLDGILAHKAMMDQPDDEDTEDTEETEGAAKSTVKKEIQETETPADAAPAETDTALAAVDVDAIAEKVLKAMNVDELKGLLGTIVQRLDAHEKKLEGVDDLEKAVEKTTKSIDERIAYELSPVSWLPGLKGLSPSESDATVAADQETAKEKATEGAPKAPDAPENKGDNMMQIGFWNQFPDLKP